MSEDACSLVPRDYENGEDLAGLSRDMYSGDRRCKNAGYVTHLKGRDGYKHIKFSRSGSL